MGKNQFPTTQLTKNNHKHWLGIFYTFISLLSIPSSSRRLFSIQIHSLWKSENYQISQYQYRFPCIKLTRSVTPDPLTLFDKFYTILLLFLNKKNNRKKSLLILISYTWNKNEENFIKNVLNVNLQHLPYTTLQYYVISTITAIYLFSVIDTQFGIKGSLSDTFQ